MSLMNYAHTNKCPKCSGCDVDGCKAQCHGSEFGVHPERDEELANLLAEEDALNVRKARDGKSDLQLMGEAAWERVTKAHGAQSDKVRARFMRFWESGSGEKYVTDAAYWMLNYAQASHYNRRAEDEINALKLEIAQLKVQVLKDQLWHAEEAVAWIEDPYRYG